MTRLPTCGMTTILSFIVLIETRGSKEEFCDDLTFSLLEDVLSSLSILAFPSKEATKQKIKRISMNN